MSDVLEVLKFTLPIAGAAFAWVYNHVQQRAWEQYQRKEDRYRELIRSLRGFYKNTPDREQRQMFLDQLNLCWLYCSDDVIQKAYAFLSTVHTSANVSDAEKEKILGEFVLAVRRDLLSRRIVRRTQLTAADFKNLSAT